MQFFKIAAYVQAANCMVWYIIRLVHFCPYINGLSSALIGTAHQAFYTILVCLGFLRRRSESERDKCVQWYFVFVSVDVNLFVNVFIYYNCMGVCAFVCVCVYILVFWVVSHLSVDWWSMAVIRQELNLFVNCFCDCMCICM